MIYHTIVILLLSCLTLGWWDVGHMLTASIAQIVLREKNPAAYILFKDLIQSMNPLCDEKSQTLVQAASWPDDIKSSKYNMHIWDAWHYKDLPYLTDGVFPIINFTEVTVNSIRIMDEAVKVLKTNMKQNSAERAVFARYLLHVAGDIHQPLHSVGLFNETFPNGDLGGNRIKITLLNSTSNFNFHSFWDSGALLVQNDSYVFPRPLTLQNQTVLLQYSLSLIQEYGQQVEKLAEIIDPVAWSKQSLQISKNTTYPFVLKNNVVTDQYSQLVYKTCKKRITLAGYRIANLVIDIFSGKNSTYKTENIFSEDRYEQLFENNIIKYQEEQY